MTKLLSIHNKTPHSAVFYYNVSPNKFYREIVVKSGDSEELTISSVKYLVGIKLNGEMMLPRAFYTAVSITLTETAGKYYYHYDFDDNEPADNVPEDLVVWFGNWAADLYKTDSRLKELCKADPFDEMSNILSKEFVARSYSQIPADYFAKCYTTFRADNSEYEIIKTIHLKSLANHQHEVTALMTLHVV